MEVGLHRLKPVLVTLGWGASIAGATLASIFQGLLLPQSAEGGLRGVGGLLAQSLLYIEVFGISVLAGLVLMDAARAFPLFFVSYGLGFFLTYWMLALPGYIGRFPLVEALVGLSLVVTFSVLFPLPLLVGLVGTLLGVALAERIF